MGKVTGISWTDHTFSPWWGCVKVSNGCKFCYAETWDRAKGGGESHWGPTAPRRFFGDKHWNEPLAWNRAAERDCVRRLVLCSSMADVFENRDDLIEHRLRLWALIEKTSHLDWLLLTKRPENVMDMAPKLWRRGHGHWPQNVWLGTSVEDQKTANKRVPILLSMPATIKFLSCEPLLGPIDLAQAGDNACVEWFESIGIRWVIVGGESGPNARPMHPQWARDLRDQRAEMEVAFFFKQHGEWLHESQCSACDQRNRGLSVVRHDAGDGFQYVRVGKTLAGDRLDGKEHKEFPKT